MLSKTEMEFLENPEAFEPNYRKVLKHRVNHKMRALRRELDFLRSAGLVTENCNRVTETCNQEISSNQVALTNLSEGVGAPAGIRTRVFGSKGRNT
jgi:hypothetical protein